MCGVFISQEVDYLCQAYGTQKAKTLKAVVEVDILTNRNVCIIILRLWDKKFKKKSSYRAEKVAQQLKKQTVLAKDQSLVPSTHIGWFLWLQFQEI